MEVTSKHADQAPNVRVSAGLLPNRLWIVSNGESVEKWIGKLVEIGFEMRFEMEIENGIQKL